MTAIANPVGWISPEEYFQGERLSDIRHEYVDGYVYAMAGASDDHNRIVGSIHGELRERLRGKRREPFMTDMKVKMPPTFADVYYDPDVLVVCDPNDNAKYFRERPSIIFEVISPDTGPTDHREKLLAYRQIPSIQVYALVEQDRMKVTVLRAANPGWTSEVIEGPQSILKLPTIGVEIPLERIYERTAAAISMRAPA